MQNDLISPRPLIHIKLKDENPFLLLNDSSFLKIEIKKPNASTYQAVQFQSEEVSYTPANSANNNELSVLYKPHFTEDGTYSMRIKVKDASNNNYNNEAYNIDFEVVNASSITHFFPYPNPFSTHTQFVFTLTGEVVPDDLKIQIMTVSGKIVREISKAELGPIKIGHNITEYKWNGTDEFGDRLANGVYLYRVVLKNANDFEKRSTSGDQYFKEGFGKLYLMK
jgi:flagellar hook assembly protein FlgD